MPLISCSYFCIRLKRQGLFFFFSSGGTRAASAAIIKKRKTSHSFRIYFEIFSHQVLSSFKKTWLARFNFGKF